MKMRAEWTAGRGYRPCVNILTLTLILLVAACGMEEGLPPDSESPGTSGTIEALRGGSVSLGKDVVLQVPAGSLADDAVIGIQQLAAPPAKAPAGKVFVGKAHRFTPAGTSFKLSTPALLSVRLDAADLSRLGVKPELTQLHYLDEKTGRYIAISGKVDTARGEVTGLVEHFTVYVVLATTLVPGNNAPKVSLQDCVPKKIRADAPIHVRATVKDFDLGGAVAGVTVYYRVPGTKTSGWQSKAMTAQTMVNADHVWAATLPASTLPPSALVAGADFEYYVEAIDNLGAKGTSKAGKEDATTSYAGKTLTISPASLSIAAGFTRVFTVEATDTDGKKFDLVPESVTQLTTLGTVVSNNAAGILFKATTNGVGKLTATADKESAHAMVSVFNGTLAKINIVDEKLQEIVGTPTLIEGRYHQFYAVGLDAHGNKINIVPTWSVEVTGITTIGTIDGKGKLYTLDGGGYGAVVAKLGKVTAKQWIDVKPRRWNRRGMDPLNVTGQNTLIDSKMVTVGETPYVAWCEYGSQDAVRVKRWDGSAWVQVGTASSINPSTHNTLCSCDAVSDGTNLYVVWGDYLPVVMVKKWTGTGWIQVGGPVHTDTTKGVDGVRITMVGQVPHVAYYSYGTTGPGVRVVKKWTGSAWVQLGGDAGGSKSVGPHDIAGSASKVYLAVANNGASSGETIMNVRTWDGNDWKVVGGPVSSSSGYTVGNPSLVISEDALFLAYARKPASSTTANSSVVVSKLTGNTWASLGSAVIPQGSTETPRAYSPAMVLYDQTPYVAYLDWQGDTPRTYKLRTRHWTGSAWVNTADPIYMYYTSGEKRPVGNPTLAMSKEKVYAAWIGRPVASTSKKDDSVYVHVLE